QADQVARQIDDLHRLTHVEHEDAAALSHHAGLQHQLRRFRNGHEVTADLRMGDGDGAAGGNLFAEFGDDTAGAAKQVAETHGDEARPFGRKRLTKQFRQAFARAHDVGGIHRLVGGDEHEFLHTVVERRLCDARGAEAVVAHRLPGVFHFHEWDMLVGGGVEYHCRAVRGKDCVEAITILDV